MKLISAKCPNCGGHLKIEEGTTKTVCEYCNKDIIIDDESIKIKISGRVSVDGIKTDKELINSANELLDMGEYIKAKKLFDQFATNNPDQYQGWLGLLICRTRNFQIRDNNILFENDIEKYYKYYQRTAPQDVKDDYFETIDRYMYPDKWKEIDREREKEKQEELRKQEEEERQKKYASAIEENKKLREAKEKEREKQLEENRKEFERREEEKRIKQANGTYVGPGEIIGQILSYIHIAWSALIAFAALLTSLFLTWFLFNISIAIFLPPLRKVMVKKWKIPYWLIIIIRIIVVIVSYVVFIIQVPSEPTTQIGTHPYGEPVYSGVWKTDGDMTLEISGSAFKITEDEFTIGYQYTQVIADNGAYIVILSNDTYNRKFAYLQNNDKISFCMLDEEGNKCAKYFTPETPKEDYTYITSE